LDGLTMMGKDPDTGKPVTKTAKTGPVDFSVVVDQKEVVKGKPKQTDIVALIKNAAFEWVDPAYSAKGALTIDVRFNPDKGTTGTTKIANLEIADDKKNVVKDPGVTIDHDIGMETKEEKGRTLRIITLKKTEVKASFVRGT